MEQVKIPVDYFFKMSMKEYYNWKEALVREFIQNSVDAGATKIDITFDSEDGWFSIADNGHGMTESIMRDSLLTLGGSYKENDSVGGLGKAKGILYFSWPEWTISSLDNYVNGEGSMFNISKANHVDGTLSGIKIGDHISNPRYIVERYYYMCNLPRVTITYNGEVLEPGKAFTTKDRIYDIDGLGSLYKTEGRAGKIIVLVNGLYMFTTHTIVDKTYIFNISSKSYECLTANRDSFRGEWNDKFSKMIATVAIDSESTCISTEQILFISKLKNTESLNDREIKTLVERFDVAEGNEEAFIEKLINGTAVIEKTMINGDQALMTKIKNMRYTKKYDAFISWYKTHFPNGFIVASEENIDGDVIELLHDRETLQLAKMWESIILEVKDILDIDNRDFGYGFVINKQTEAQYRNGYILFNPYVFYEIEDWDDAAFKMIMLVCHEMTHALGYKYHNEEFNLRFDDMLFKVLKERINTKDIVKELSKVKKKLS